MGSILYLKICLSIYQMNNYKNLYIRSLILDCSNVLNFLKYVLIILLYQIHKKFNTSSSIFTQKVQIYPVKGIKERNWRKKFFLFFARIHIFIYFYLKRSSYSRTAVSQNFFCKIFIIFSDLHPNLIFACKARMHNHE